MSDGHSAPREDDLYPGDSEVQEEEGEGDTEVNGSEEVQDGDEFGDDDDDDDVSRPSGLSVLVCGQPFEHRTQSSKRRTQSAKLRNSAGTVKLAGVKQELYNPALPSLRRMDMDDTGHRLAFEHSRATSALTRKSFGSARTTFFQPADRLPSKRITESGGPLETRLRIQSASFPHRPVPWNTLLESMSQIPRRAASAPFPKDQTYIHGFTSRHISPAMRQSWKMSLHGDSGVNQSTFSQHLVPADLNYRHRSLVPQYGQPAFHPSGWR